MRKSRTSVKQKAIQKVRLLDKRVNPWNYKLIYRKGFQQFIKNLRKFAKIHYFLI